MEIFHMSLGCAFIMSFVGAVCTGEKSLLLVQSLDQVRIFGFTNIWHFDLDLILNFDLVFHFFT
jgi:hypothetical protein